MHWLFLEKNIKPRTDRDHLYNLNLLNAFLFMVKDIIYKFLQYVGCLLIVFIIIKEIHCHSIWIL